MGRILANQDNAPTPDSDYPYSKIKDNTGAGDGTPVNEKVYGDIHQFFAKMANDAGITLNDLPDNAYSGFQFFQAFIDIGMSHFVKDIILSFIGTYTTNDLIILYGCTISATIPGTSSITAGAIYYNGKIYNVPADASIVTSGGQTLIFVVNENIGDEPSFIELQAGTSGTGIANYNGATVKTFIKAASGIYDIQTLSLENSYIPGGGLTDPKCFKDAFGNVQLIGNVQSPAVVTNAQFATLPIGYRPLVTPRIFYVGQVTTSQDNIICYVETNGECRLYVNGGTTAVDASKSFNISSVRFNINA